MRRMVHKLNSDRGIALVMSLGVLVVIGVTTASLLTYTSTNLRTAQFQKARPTADGIAEAGIADALAVINNVPANDPTNASLLPSAGSPRVTSFDGGTVSWYGSYDSVNRIWTITATSTVKNPTGAAALHRTLTRQVSITPSANGDWDRIYNHDNAGCFTIASINIPSKLATRGDLCLTGTTQLTGSTVDVGGKVTLASGSPGTNIGASGTPITRASIAGTCKYGSGTAHTPCGSADHVYASTNNTSPTNLGLPSVDWDYWYANAAPGPMHPCTTTSGSPPAFDKNTTYNKDNPEQELTPEPGTHDNPGSSGGGTIGDTKYTCQVWQGGTKIGELSWNNQTRVLTVSGTIFFDGNAVFHDHNGYVVHYQGQATIFIAGNWHDDEAICAGGSGTTTCRTAGAMPNWTPSQNLLVIIAGGKQSATNRDFDFHTNYSVFQGLLYAKNDCDIHDTAYVSAPVICNDINLSDSPQFYAWPPIGALLPGETQGTGAYAISLLGQSG